MDEEFDPLRILANLREHEVSYVLVGGLAAAVQGSPVQTNDVDIILPPDDENIEKLGLVLRDLGARQEPEATEGEHKASFTTTAGRLDCLESPRFAAVESDAVEVDVGRGITVRVASVDQLAQLKRASGDLVGAARLSALSSAASDSTAPVEDGPVDPEPPVRGRVGRVLKKLEGVDTFLTNLNSGELPRPHRKSRGE